MQGEIGAGFGCPDGNKMSFCTPRCKVSQGYALFGGNIVDIFPCTAHVECVVLITRVEK